MQGNDRMEEIMAEIREHLLPVIDYGANGNVHHYNRVWEKIDRWFKKHASQPHVQADTRCRCNSETYKQCAFYDGAGGCVHPPRTA